MEKRDCRGNGTGRGRRGLGSFLQGRQQQEGAVDRGPQQRDARQGLPEGEGQEDAEDVFEPAAAEEVGQRDHLDARPHVPRRLLGQRRHRMGQR